MSSPSFSPEYLVSSVRSSVRSVICDSCSDVCCSPCRPACSRTNCHSDRSHPNSSHPGSSSDLVGSPRFVRLIVGWTERRPASPSAGHSAVCWPLHHRRSDWPVSPAAVVAQAVDCPLSGRSSFLSEPDVWH